MNESETRINSPPPKKEKAAEEGSVVESEKENQTPAAVITIVDEAPVTPVKGSKSETSIQVPIAAVSSASKISLDAKPKNSPARKPRRTKAELEKEKKEREEQRKLRLEEIAKRKAEKDREKEEKRKAKELADKERAEKKRLENEEKLKKEAEREKKRLEKEAKEKLAREEREKRQKEKDDLRKQKEDEEKRKHEEKEKEQKAQEEKEEKARQQRAKFFQSFSKKKISTKNEKIEHESRWAPFCPHKNQFLCPIVFHKWTDSEEKDFEKFLKLLCDGKSDLAKEIKYLHEIKSRPARCRGKREKPKKSEDECILIDPQLETALKEGARFKYFNFHTDYRPPFFGTDRRKSQFVNPKNPHAKDPDLDYDYDSGEDWEDEPEGEKISDDEKLSDEEDMDEEDQDGFFVPHGYLSDDEANAARDPDDTEEQTKLTEAELKERQEKFNRMRKKRLRKLVVYHEGPLYDADSEETDNLENGHDSETNNEAQQDNEADRFDWEGVHYLLEGSPDPLRDYSDNEIGSIDGIWNEIPSSEESQIENVQLDDDEEESLVDAEDLNPSDEEDFVELENQAWDNSEMKNWSDFEKVRDELVKITEERKTNLMETDVQKTESEVELEAIWGVEKTSKQRRKRTRAHASRASVNNLRASRYVDLTNMKLILTDGVQSGTGLPIEDFQGMEDVSKVKEADVVEALSQVSLDTST